MNLLGNVKELGRRLKVHNVAVSSAGIAFYGLLALVPTLVALISIYGLITDPNEISEQVSDAAGSLDETTQTFISDLLKDIVGVDDETGEAGSAVGRWLGVLFGIGLALFSASGAVQKLMGTISVAYEAEESRPGWRLRLLAYGFTLGAIIGVIVMTLTIGALPAILDRVDMPDAVRSVISIVQFPLLGVLFAGALTVLYRYSPDRSPRTPWRNPGAAVGTLLFLFFAIAFSIYSSNVGLLPASYGLLGSVAALMIFLQLTALAVIVGAEANAAVEAPASIGAANPAGRQLQATGAAVAGGATPGTGGALVPYRPDAATTDPNQPAPALSFGKAMAGLLALFALARGISGD
jgi:membrane protein